MCADRRRAGVVNKMIEADGIIYAARCTGFGTPSLLQTFLERAGVGYLRFDRPLSNKVAGIVAVAAGQPGTITSRSSRELHAEPDDLWWALGSPRGARPAPGDAAKDEEGPHQRDPHVDRMIDMMSCSRDYKRLSGKDDILPAHERNERRRVAAHELEHL